MFKSLLLSSIRVYEAPNDQGAEKTPAQIERDKIKVDTSKKTEQKEDDADTKTGDDKGDEKGEDDNEEIDDEGEDENKEEEKELTAEQKTIASLEKKIARLEKRVGRTAGERDTIRKELISAKASLEAKVNDGEGLTEEEVDRRANIKADEIANDRAFKAAQAKLIKDATKVDKDFLNKVNEMAVEVAPIPSVMIGVLEDLDNGGAVLAYLADNPEEYEEIYDLSLARMSNRLSKLSDKIEEDKKVKPKKISQVPAPIDGIKGGSESPNVLPEKPNKDAASMEKFVKLRQHQAEAHRKKKMGIAG